MTIATPRAMIAAVIRTAGLRAITALNAVWMPVHTLVAADVRPIFVARVPRVPIPVVNRPETTSNPPERSPKARKRPVACSVGSPKAPPRPSRRSAAPMSLPSAWPTEPPTASLVPERERALPSACSMSRAIPLAPSPTLSKVRSRLLESPAKVIVTALLAIETYPGDEVVDLVGESFEDRVAVGVVGGVDVAGARDERAGHGPVTADAAAVVQPRVVGGFGAAGFDAGFALGRRHLDGPGGCAGAGRDAASGTGRDGFGGLVESDAQKFLGFAVE